MNNTPSLLSLEGLDNNQQVRLTLRREGKQDLVVEYSTIGGGLRFCERAEIKRTTDIYRGQIVDVSASVYTVQLTGTSDKLDSFIQSIGTASILETVRSGVTGIARGDKVLSI